MLVPVIDPGDINKTTMAACKRWCLLVLVGYFGNMLLLPCMIHAGCIANTSFRDGIFSRVVFD